MSTKGRTINVSIPNKDETRYEIKIERGLINKVGSEIRRIHSKNNLYIITDSVVGPIYKDVVTKSLKEQGFNVHLMMIKAGETSKNIKTLTEVYDFLIENNASRKDLLIALGGGVVGDLAGYAAATYMRGMPFCQIPTSLLAQIDSSVGGKVAVNLPQGKNLVGAFKQPKLVLIDPELLNTLPERNLKDGAAEAVKYGCIRDREMFEIFQKIEDIKDIHPYLDEIIYRSCDIKREIVERDEKEQGERMLLNFGHTLGHAVEAYYNYEKYTHGEAVAIGMVYIAEVSEALGYAKPGVATKIKEVLDNLGLPSSLEAGLDDINKIKEAMVKNIAHDKKNNSETSHLILIKDIGDVVIETIRTEEIKEFFKKGGFL